MFGNWPSKIIFFLKEIKNQLFHNSVGTETVVFSEKKFYEQGHSKYID